MGSTLRSTNGGTVPTVSTKYIRQRIWQGSKLLAAAFCLGFGICMFIECGLGSDPIDVLLDGANRTFGISLGQANLMLNFAMFVIGLLVNRRAIGLPSVIGAVLGSLIVDMVNPLIIALDLSSKAMAWRVMALLIGQICLCCCYGIMQTIPHGSNISDAFVQWVASVSPGTYAFWRMMYDGLCFVIGSLWGGIFGIGTIVSVLTTGVCTRLIAGGVRMLDAAMIKQT